MVSLYVISMYKTVIIQLCQGKDSFSFYGTFNVNKLLWNGKIPWMLKLLNENIDANKEPLLYMNCCFIIS